MDVYGSGNNSCVEFYRYFGWERDVFAERIFDSYLVPQDGSNNHWTEKKDGLSLEQFLVCVWNYFSRDERMMAQYVYNIFDIDKLNIPSKVTAFAFKRYTFHPE